MEYQLNLGAWNSVFAVPCNIVDKHLKLAGAAQLKTILWVLRHAGENFTVEDISAALSMSAADVRDSMLYWKETGVISENEGIFYPPEPEISVKKHIDEPQTEEISETEPENDLPEIQNTKRALSRPEKPDMRYLNERMANDESVTYLINTADEIFGRPTSNNDKATLLMIHETDGMPVEVLIMLMQYASSLGKCNIRYIEKMALNWVDEEILSLDAAEKKIQELTSGRNAAVIIQKLFGMDKHSPTDRETLFADRWLNQWKFSPEVIRIAYEICVDAKGKVIMKYINSVLERWYSGGISTVEQAMADQEKGKKKKQKKDEPTYDLSEYESTNAIIEEGY